MQRTARPVFLNLARIRFPVGAVASAGHRISGVLLLCALPLAAWALQRSLGGEDSFRSLVESLRSVSGRVLLAALAWACAHHLFAGVRHLLTDVGVGSSLPAARLSAYAVIIAALLVAAAAALA